MMNIIKQFTPSEWQQPYEDPLGKTYRIIQLLQRTAEYNEIYAELIRAGLGSFYKISRVQNLHDLGQFLLRGQLLLANNPQVKYYRVRRFVCIDGAFMEAALEYNIDPRRCNIPSDQLTFLSYIQNISPNQVVFIVRVVTPQPNSRCVRPDYSAEYYIEYIAEM